MNKTLKEKGIMEPRFYDVRDQPITFFTEDDVREAIKKLRGRIKDLEFISSGRFTLKIDDIFGVWE